MDIDVAGLIAGNTGSNRGQTCSTCAWLAGRPDEERAAWVEHMARPKEDVQHAAVQRAMQEASELTKYRKAPSSTSVRRHRIDRHDRH